jgi:hypothetical protein
MLRPASEIWHLKVYMLKVNSNTNIIVLYVAYSRVKMSVRSSLVKNSMGGHGLDFPGSG